MDAFDGLANRCAIVTKQSRNEEVAFEHAKPIRNE